MAMTIAQQNIASEIQKISSELVSIKGRMTALTQMYTNEGMGNLTDADFATYPEMAHVTGVEFQGAGAALVAINTTLGDWSANSNVAKMLKILKGMPK